MAALHLACRQYYDFTDSLINIQQLFLRRRPFGKGTDPRYYVTRTAGVLSDALDGLPCFFQVRRLP